MKRLHVTPILTVLIAGLTSIAGCVVEDEDDLGSSSHEVTVDVDRDGIDDNLENTLLQRHAPIVFLNTERDWTRPGNVHWSLARMRMRMHHNNCSDTQITNYPNANNILTRAYRRRTRGWWGCSWKTPWQYSNSSWHRDDHYFLQYKNDNDHAGPSSASQWIVYGHVYPGGAGGYNVQYWFYYPYNDWFSYANHEGDFEMITVTLDANQNMRGAYYAYHTSVTWFDKDVLARTDETHPHVFSADGSHASYRLGGEPCHEGITIPGSPWDVEVNIYGVPVTLEFNGLTIFEDNCTWSNYHHNRWFTGAGMKGSQAGFQGGGVVNVGEKNFPMPGHEWIQYSGRWGEKGNFEFTSGPRGPAYQGNWNIGRPSVGGGGGGSNEGGGDNGECDDESCGELF